MFLFGFQCVAFDDVNPQAPAHFLVLPKKKIISLVHAAEEDAEVSEIGAKNIIYITTLFEL